MSLPVMVIVGRPNVGKSTLFNKIVRKGAAIVENIPGVTRDRNYMEAEWDDHRFIAVDTGGFYSDTEPDIEQQVKEQALFAVEEGDLIIQILDAKDGLRPADMDLASLIRASGKKFLFVVNKVDTLKKEELVADFYALGAEPMYVSAQSGHNFDEFMDRSMELLSEIRTEEPENGHEYPKIAVVGRPNVGKSTLINGLLGKNRMIVSPVPGTTRDSIDSICTFYGKKYLFIDTAGIRRKLAMGYPIERFAMMRAMRSIERADICLIVIDAVDGLVAEDQKIAGMVLEQGKSAVFLINKWDLVADKEAYYKKLSEDIKRKMFFMTYAPMITISGLEKKRITNVFPVIDKAIEERRKRIPTTELNEYVKSLLPPPFKGKKVAMSFMSQVGIEPPRFVLFTNRPEAFKDDYMRHFERLMREQYSFASAPIMIKVKAKDIKPEVAKTERKKPESKPRKKPENPKRKRQEAQKRNKPEFQKHNKTEVTKRKKTTAPKVKAKKSF